MIIETLGDDGESVDKDRAPKKKKMNFIKRSQKMIKNIFSSDREKQAKDQPNSTPNEDTNIFKSPPTNYNLNLNGHTTFSPNVNSENFYNERMASG